MSSYGSMDEIVSLTGTSVRDEENRQSTHSQSSSLTNSAIPEQGCLYTIASFMYLRWENVKQSWNESWCGKIRSIFMFITLPCYIFARPLLRRQSYRTRFSHSGIVYFYILLGCTVVFNLWEQQTKSKSQSSTSFQFLQYFEASCMILSLVFMLYVACSTRGRVVFVDHDQNLILYFRTGLYVFGISSLIYTTLNLVNYCNCGSVLHIFVNSAKFLYIIGQILFLNRFYQAKLPNDTPYLQIALAHILGTNLSLWIWTLCKEVYEPPEANSKTHCKTFPIRLTDTERYFYPLFVEYLLLVAAMIYELWANLRVTSTSNRRNVFHSRFDQNYFEQVSIEDSNSETASSQSPRAQSNGRLTPVWGSRRNFTPSLAVSLILGLSLSSIFIAFVLASNESGKTHPEQFTELLIVNVCMYCCEIIVCYIAMLSRHSQQLDERRTTADLDDALLYLGLAGILLWEGFHLYGLIFAEDSQNIEFVSTVLGILEDIVQTVTFVTLRRYCSSHDENARTVSRCAHFLLATNFAYWCQNSFYIEQDLENPGEDHKDIHVYLNVFGHILNPLIIFFRFHSATCSYHIWYIFSRED